LGKFARLLRRNIGIKLNKVRKSRELIAFIKRERKEILEKLLRDHLIANEDTIEMKIESVFKKVNDK